MKTTKVFSGISLFALYIFSSFSSIFAQDSLVNPKWSKNLSIYEVNIRQYSNEGTIKAVEKDLPRIKNLGVGILWLMPVNPIGNVNRKGSLGSYYAVKDYNAFNPEYGTMDDFKSFVKSAHKLGLYVIIDWVANHTSWDNVWVKEHPEYYTKDQNGKFVPPVPDWSDVIDLNYDNKDLRKSMINSLKFWINKTGIDGFRCDVAGMVPTDFWNEARAELNKIKNTFMLAEDESPELQKKAFNMTYSWNLYSTFNDIAKGIKNADSLAVLFENESHKYLPEYYRMRFITNHDENSWNGTEFERLGDEKAVEAFTTLYFTLPGMPLIYNGQECALNKRLNFFEKDPINWKEHKLFSLFQSLNKLKKNNHALWNGNYGGNIVFHKINPSIACFERKLNDNIVTVIINLSKTEQNIELSKLPKIDGNIDYFNNQKYRVDGRKTLQLTPWEYKILVK